MGFENIPDDTVPVTAFLKELLKMANKERPLLIFLDSVDELTGSQDSNKMSWLPLKIPPHCKIVVSCTYEEGNPALMQDVNFLRQLFEDDNQFLEVTALGTELSWTVMKLWMDSAGRSLNNFQWRVVANALDQCTLPIFCKLVFQEVCRWKSYSAPAKTVLMTNVQDSVFQLFQRVENKHGWMLVSHALAYVTASKNGVSEPEIEDSISLDDKVLDDIYQYHLPPTRRIPPLLWTRVRSDFPGCRVRRPAVLGHGHPEGGPPGEARTHPADLLLQEPVALRRRQQEGEQRERVWTLCVKVCARGNQTVGVRVSFRYIHQGSDDIRRTPFGLLRCRQTETQPIHPQHEEWIPSTQAVSEVHGVQGGDQDGAPARQAQRRCPH